jgi:predicted RNase H-like HicB family nuclease
MSRYLIVVEETETGYSAYSPDLDACVAAGATREEVKKRTREVVEFHLEGLKSEGFPVPKPHSFSSYLEVSS